MKKYAREHLDEEWWIEEPLDPRFVGVPFGATPSANVGEDVALRCRNVDGYVAVVQFTIAFAE